MARGGNRGGVTPPVPVDMWVPTSPEANVVLILCDQKIGAVKVILSRDVQDCRVDPTLSAICLSDKGGEATTVKPERCG